MDSRQKHSGMTVEKDCFATLAMTLDKNAALILGSHMAKLLIVDDESDIREFARNFFKKRKIEVIIASGGRQALDLIAQESPDLVLLDVRMEEMTGIEVLRDLRKTNPSVKVIMVSGVEDEETIKEANALGVIGYIHKPFILEELEKIVLAQL